MDPLSIAMLASSVFKYNSEVKNAANLGLRNAVFARGGKYSEIKPEGMDNVPNFWGDVAAGGTAAAMNERGAHQDQANQQLLSAITKRYSGQNLDFAVPNDEDRFNAIAAHGRAMSGDDY